MSKKKEMIARLESIEKRLDQLECNHDIECVREDLHAIQGGYNGYSYYEEEFFWGTEYYEQCTKCGKRFKDVSKQEYLEYRIKKNDEEAKKKKEELKALLKQIKEQNAN